MTASRRFASTCVLVLYATGALVPCAVAAPARSLVVASREAADETTSPQAGHSASADAPHAHGEHVHEARVSSESLGPPDEARGHASHAPPSGHDAHEETHAGHATAHRHGHHGQGTPDGSGGAPAHEPPSPGRLSPGSTGESATPLRWVARCRCGCDQVASPSFTALTWHARLAGVEAPTPPTVLDASPQSVPPWTDRGLEPPTPVPLLG